MEIAVGTGAESGRFDGWRSLEESRGGFEELHGDGLPTGAHVQDRDGYKFVALTLT